MVTARPSSGSTRPAAGWSGRASPRPTGSPASARSPTSAKTRDSFGHAMKATDVVINGEEIAIFKDPVTDTSKMKKSQTGRVAVLEHDGSYKFLDRLNRSGFHPHGGFISKDADCLQTVFLNGAPTKFQTFGESVPGWPRSVHFLLPVEQPGVNR